MPPKRATKNSNKVTAAGVTEVAPESDGGGTELVSISKSIPQDPNDLILRGYAPSTSYSMRYDQLKFNGQAKDYPVFKIRLRNHFKRLGLYETLTSDTPDPIKTDRIWQELVPSLDDATVSCLESTSNQNGKLAYEQLIHRFEGDIMARKYSASMEWDNLKMKNCESITDYLS
ncbi:unnamed protein product, partial [Meganyctiphanes norvegica]